MADDRNQTLRHLIGLDRPLRAIADDLDRFPFGCEPADEVELRRDDAASVLERYLAGQLSAQQVEEWACLIDGREDIRLEPGYDRTLSELILVLAHLDPADPFTPRVARFCLDRLRAPGPAAL
jgi:hypothetical protein